MRILVAMSGGIDSSTVAHLLVREGHEVIGVRFNLWVDPLAPASAQILPTKCCTTQNIHRANTVAQMLSFPIYTHNVEEKFKRTIVDRFLRDYSAGLTPNPCVLCNRTIKHAELIRLMKKFKCEKVATGHYARIRKSTDGHGKTVYRLLQARDKTKDQSYYLYGLSQSQLSATLFPLGNLLKSEVFALAKEFKIPLPDSYVESQDLCFFPEKSPHAFLKRHLGETLRSGPIETREGEVLGTHEGIPLYTIGQRRGLRVGGQRIPLHVIKKDSKRNALIVAPQGSVLINGIRVSSLRFVSDVPTQHKRLPFQYRTRSLAAKKRGWLVRKGSRATFFFAKKEQPQTPGQSLVLYRGSEIVGGGIITANF
jgi:tRNA-specific 2-thiouridylase